MKRVMISALITTPVKCMYSAHGVYPDAINATNGRKCVTTELLKDKEAIGGVVNLVCTLVLDMNAVTFKHYILQQAYNQDTPLG